MEIRVLEGEISTHRDRDVQKVGGKEMKKKKAVEDRTRIERVTVRTAAERSTSELPVQKLSTPADLQAIYMWFCALDSSSNSSSSSSK